MQVEVVERIQVDRSVKGLESADESRINVYIYLYLYLYIFIFIIKFNIDKHIHLAMCAYK